MIPYTFSELTVTLTRCHYVTWRGVMSVKVTILPRPVSTPPGWLYAAFTFPALCYMLTLLSEDSCHAPARREGSSKRCFCPSVSLSVAYIANNSRTQRPSVPKLGRNVPHLRCNSHSSFKVKSQGHCRPINADTRRAPYIPTVKAYELQTWYTDPLQPHAPWPPRS